MKDLFYLPSPLEALDTELTSGIQVWIKRDDLIHPGISGNKWRKLKGYVLEAKAKGIHCLASFGGAYSNHISALASLCHEMGFQGHAFIRGEAEYQQNASLQQASALGLQLTFLDREQYRKKEDPDFLKHLSKSSSAPFLWIPEGGFGPLGLQGCGEIIQELNEQLPAWEALVCPVGSGCTLAGLLSSKSVENQIFAVPVLKNADYLIGEIEKLCPDAQRDSDFQWWNTFHFGGYARVSEELLEFCMHQAEIHGLLLDPVYTAKAFYALWQKLHSNSLLPNKIVFLHTGGLQGWRGMLERGLISQAYYERLLSLSKPPHG